MAEVMFPTEWLEEFANKIKSKKRTTVEERISILMCNYNNDEQNEELRKILFDDHLSIAFWSKYVELTLKLHKSSASKSSLAKMVKKSLECLEPVEKTLKDDVRYIVLHLHYVSFLSDNIAMLHISSQMNRKDLGKTFAALYIKWAEIHLRLVEVEAKKITAEQERIQTRIKGIDKAMEFIQKGVFLNALPEGLLLKKLKALQQDKKALQARAAAAANNSSTDSDDVVVLKTKASTRSSKQTSGDRSRDSSREEEGEEGSPSYSSAASKSAAPSVSSSSSSSIARARSARSGVLSNKAERVTKSSQLSPGSNDDDNDDTVQISPLSASPETVNDENKPPASSYKEQLRSKPVSRMPFSIDEIGAPAPTQSAAGVTRAMTPAAKSTSTRSVRKASFPPTSSRTASSPPVDEDDREADNCLNDSVVQFKSQRKQSTSTAAKVSSRSSSRSSSLRGNLNDSVVSFKITTSKAAARSSGDSGSDGDDCTVRLKSPSSHNDSATDSFDNGDTVAIPQPQQQSVRPVVPVSVSVPANDGDDEDDDSCDQDTVQIPSPSGTPAGVAASSATTTSKRVSLSPILQNTHTHSGEIHLQTGHSFNDSSADMDVDTVAVDPALFPPAKQGGLNNQPSVSAANPQVLASVTATPANGKRKRRVSFAGGSSPPLPPAASKDEDENRDSAEPAPMAVAKTPARKSKQSSFVASASVSDGSFKNNFDDPANQITLNGHQYVQFGVIGKGGSGVVTRIVSKETGLAYAYKRISIQDTSHTDPDAIERQFEDHENEIKLLKSLQGSSLIIELRDYEVNRQALYVSMVLELGDIDLARVLSSFQKPGNSRSAGGKSSSTDSLQANMPRELDPRKIWKEMLDCVQCIHDKNIIHGDLKPANFVFVHGYLKLIDFGIANSISNDTTNVHLESQKGTLNYMSPESLTASDSKPSKQQQNTEANQNERTRTMCLGRSSDVWSLGCILYQIMYGRAPFADFAFIQKIGVITNKDHKIPYPETNSAGVTVDTEAIASMQACLIHDRRARALIKDLLKMPFLTMKCACHCVQRCVASAAAPQNTSVTSTSHGTTSHSGSSDDVSASSQMMTVNVQPFKNVPLQEIPPHSSARKLASSNTSAAGSGSGQSALSAAARRDETGDFTRHTRQVAALESTKKIKGIFSSSRTAMPFGESAVVPSTTSASSASAVTTQSSTAGTRSSSFTRVTDENAHRTVSATPSALMNGGARNPRAPLKALPQNIQMQITANDAKKRMLTSTETSDRAAKWQKTAVAPKQDSMKAAIVDRMASMRQFLHQDDDNTATVTITNTFFDL